MPITEPWVQSFKNPVGKRSLFMRKVFLKYTYCNYNLEPKHTELVYLSNKMFTCCKRTTALPFIHNYHSIVWASSF